jgi:hypothetical protein
MAAITLGQGKAFSAATSKSDWGNLQALTPGAQVRLIETDHKSLRGTFQSVNDDALTIDLSPGRQMVARASVASVSLRGRGHRLRHMFIGLGAGTAGGLAAGTGFDAAFPCRYKDLGCVPEPNVGKYPSAKEIVTPIGTVLGLAVGALIPAGGWREIYRFH